MKRTVLVTGACGGIGQSITKTLLKDGYSIIALGRDKKKLAMLKDKNKLFGKIDTRVLDLLSLNDISKTVDSVDGKIFGIINNAGICITESISQRKSIKKALRDWNEVINVNLTGPFMLTRLLIPKLLSPGRIVNISSQLGIEGRAGYGSYSASKFGLIGLTKCWAKELGERQVTVNAICPGWVQTQQAVNDMKRLAKERGIAERKYYNEICHPLELKRFTMPEEIAFLISFLLSDRGKGITGRDWLLNTIWNQE